MAMNNYCYECELVSEVTGEVKPCDCNSEWRSKAPKAELAIVEVDYQIDGQNTWIVNAIGDEYAFDPPVFESAELIKCVEYCYELGVNFKVNTLKAWNREHNYAD